jgi:O-antigen ligase
MLSRRPVTPPGTVLVPLLGELRVALVVGGVAIIATALAMTLGPVALGLAVAAAAAYALIRRPPVLLALFVFVPYFEAAPGVSAIPFDPTAGLAVLVILVLARRLLTGEGVRMPPVAFLVPLVVIGAAVLLGLLWSDAPDYGREKAVKYFTVTLLAALAPFALLTTERDLRRFLYAIVAGALAVAALTLVTEPTVAEGIATEYDTQGRYSFGGQIFPARFLCTGALILFLLPGMTRSRWRLLAPVAALGVAIVAVGYGARGPIAAFAATLGAVALILAARSTRSLAAVLAAVVVAVAVLPFVTVPTSASERLGEAARDPVATVRGDTRWILYDQAIQLIERDPVLGSGTGTFGAYVSIVSPPRQRLLYPHNIFLELWAELGIVPLLAFVVAVGGGAWVLVRRLAATYDRNEHQLLAVAFGLLVYNLLVAQVSGDLNDNRTLLLAAGLAWLLGRHGVGPRETA